MAGGHERALGGWGVGRRCCCDDDDDGGDLRGM